MTIKRTLAAGTAVAATTALGLGLVAGPASAKQGTTPLAGVLVDQDTGDNNGKDYDILTEAVLAVLGAKPDSPVSALTKGKTRLTAFAPQDRAFIGLVTKLTGTKPASEQAAFQTIAGAFSIDAIESILLYHVVPGKPITAKQAAKSNGAKLKTAQGKRLTVVVKKGKVYIKDGASVTKNAKVVQADINKGNRQIAHGINQVLLPANPAG
ncbi:MAG: fasciclin domain-containing protein [Candidatus Nanopelagicales bacterium]